MKKQLLLSIFAFIFFNALKAQNNNYTPIIDVLQVNEFYEVLVSHAGCFSNSKEAFGIGRDENGYYIIYKGKTQALTTTQLNAIRTFETELLLPRSGGCTSVSTYILSYAGQQQKFVDGSCAWKGYGNLKKTMGWN